LDVEGGKITDVFLYSIRSIVDMPLFSDNMLNDVILLIGAFLFLGTWLLGVYSVIRKYIYRYKLRKLVNKIDSSIPTTSRKWLIFRQSYTKKPYNPNRIWNIISSNGSRKSVLEYINYDMDVKRIRKLKNKDVDLFLERYIDFFSDYAKNWILGLKIILGIIALILILTGVSRLFAPR
jgi:hypothetical protein